MPTQSPTLAPAKPTDAQLLATQKALLASSPDTFNAQINTLIKNTGPDVLKGMVKKVKDYPLYVRFMYDYIMSDPKLATPFKAIMAYNKEDAEALEKALGVKAPSPGTSFFGSIKDILNKDVVGHVPVWGVGAGLGAILMGYAGVKFFRGRKK